MKYNIGSDNKIFAERYIWKNNNTQGFKFKKNRERGPSLPHSKTYTEVP